MKRNKKIPFHFFCLAFVHSYPSVFVDIRIDILSVVPDLLTSPFSYSILKRAQAKGVAEIHVHNIRDFAFNKHKTVDDAPFGGGAGMVMMIEPVVLCIEKLQSERKYNDIIYM